MRIRTMEPSPRIVLPEKTLRLENEGPERLHHNLLYARNVIGHDAEFFAALAQMIPSLSGYPAEGCS